MNVCVCLPFDVAWKSGFSSSLMRGYPCACSLFVDICIQTGRKWNSASVGLIRVINVRV